MIVRRHYLEGQDDRLEILEAKDQEEMEGRFVKQVMEGQVPWVTVELGRHLVFQDDFDHRLEYELDAYDGSVGVWRAHRVKS